MGGGGVEGVGGGGAAFILARHIIVLEINFRLYNHASR